MQVPDMEEGADVGTKGERMGHVAMGDYYQTWWLQPELQVISS